MNKKSFKNFFKPNRLQLLSIFCLLVFSGASDAASISGDIRRGNEFYKEGKYQNAAEKFNEALQKNPESDIINFNSGTASYKIGDFEKASEYFQKALLSEEPVLKQQAHYNLGNSFYRQAEGAGSANPQAALPFLEKSLSQYEEALKIDADEEDVKYNYEFVKKVLEKVKEQIRQQSGQCKKREKSDQSEEQEKSDQSEEQEKSDQSEDRKESGQNQDRKESDR
ncbi:MAG: tetratricopeptide repeat protein, partial [Candidatus Omnitrophota bacterium]